MLCWRKTAPTFDEVSPGIVRNTSKCVLCGRCKLKLKATSRFRNSWFVWNRDLNQSRSRL